MSVPGLVLADGVTGLVLLGSGGLAWWRRRAASACCSCSPEAVGSPGASSARWSSSTAVPWCTSTSPTRRVAPTAPPSSRWSSRLCGRPLRRALREPLGDRRPGDPRGRRRSEPLRPDVGSGPEGGAPALAAAFGFALVLGLSSANVLLDLQRETTIAFAYDVVVCLIALGLTADLLLGRWTEATVADLVSQLNPDTDAAGLQAALRRALNDPDLVLGYWVEERSAYVDDAGQRLDLTTLGDEVVTEVQDEGRPAAVLVHSATVAEDADLLEGAVAVARLAMGNARMRLEAEGRAAQLAAARRRLVEVADEQRRALASELAQGADRHLGAVADHLAQVETPDDPALRETLATLQAETGQAESEVRALLAGIRPLSLESGGLPVALAELGDRAPLPVEVRTNGGRLSPAIESAIYFVCAEALTNAVKHAAADGVAIEVGPHEDGVVVVVTDDGRGGADPAGSGLRGLADRVESLGGVLRVGAGPEGGTRLEARLPTGTGASR